MYYEQYLTIWKDSIFSLGISLATILSVSFILTGFDFIAAFIIFLMVVLILINMGGMMALWDISLNAISLVNLVVVSIKQYRFSFFFSPSKSKFIRLNVISFIQCIGIGVEFVSHIVRAFCKAEGSNEERASKALYKMGSSVLSGITLTKFSGILVLAFAKSQVSQSKKKKINESMRQFRL